MHAEEIVLAAEGSALTLEEHLAALRAERPRVFWVGLTLALLAHALLIIGIGRSSNRTLGKEDGASDAIAVEIVDGATLKDSMAPPAPPASAAPAKPKPQQQPQQPQQAQPEVPPTPPTPPEVAAQPPPEAAQPPPPTPPDAKAAEQVRPEDFADTLSALQDTPADQRKPKKAPEAEKPVPKQETKEAEKQPPKPAQPKQPQQQQAKAKPPQKRTQTSALDLSMPTDDGPDADEGGSGSAVQRPPGITRSGENDEFARNVIRALQKTMPHVPANGRVTVRIVLSENGSRADVKLLKSGGDPDLDFNVMFAARQTAYPFPPGNSTLVDRTFTVTYIYR